VRNNEIIIRVFLYLKQVLLFNPIINLNMKLLVYIERINLLHKLIKQGRTGKPAELSKRLGVSPSRLHRVIEELRFKGAPIAYSRQMQTYYYEFGYDISISATFAPLDEKEIVNVSGGSFLFNSQIVLHRGKLLEEGAIL
jgi:hypothetical protein